MQRLCIHHHLGLGDHFDCNGMVRFMLEKGDFEQVHVFSPNHLFHMIEYMYRDNPNIVVIEIDREQNEYKQVAEYMKSGKCSHFLRVGHEFYPTEHEKKYNKNCWELFYDQVKIPYEVRVDYFYVERDPDEEDRVLNKLNPSGEPFMFVHDDPERGFTVDRKYILNQDLIEVQNDMSENAFHFLKVLEEAQEIHCMESSFKSLIDFYAQTDKLFYHDFRDHPLGNHANKKWEIIRYEL